MPIPIKHAPPHKTVCYVTDKSGGHIIPCMTHALHRTHTKPFYQAYVITGGSNLEKKICSENQDLPSLTPHTIPPVPPIKQWWEWPLFCWSMLQAWIKSCYILSVLRPAKIISFGGLTSIPTGLAAWFMHIPVYVHELNVIPGKAIRLLHTFANKTYTYFTQTKAHFATSKQKPYPLRFTDADLIYNQNEIKKKIGLQPDRYTIAICGGSQGAQELNTLVPDAIHHFAQLHNIPVQVIHQTGMTPPEQIAQQYSRNTIPAVCRSYFSDMTLVYQAADIMISRCGAGSLFEIAHFQKPCIMVPLCNQANNHQVHNAQAFERQYSGIFHHLTTPTKKELAHQLQALFLKTH